MKKVLFLLIVVLALSACSSTPTAPPTQAPNPYAEEVLLAMTDASNNQEYEKAKTFFSEEYTIENTVADITHQVPQGLQEFFSGVAYWEAINEFSEFTVIGDSVKFKWLWKDFEEQCECKGSATMDEDKIIYLEINSCNCIALPTVGD